MGQILRGPFSLKYGPNTLAQIEKVNFSYSVDTTDTATVQGQKVRTYGAHQAEITVTFMQSDVASLAAVLSQYFVANGGVLSTGETVTDPNGAIDIVPGGCAAAQVASDLIIQSCGGSNSYYIRVLQCVSEIAGVTMDEKSATIDVAFTGQPTAATMQIFKNGAITNVS
jgi:hypothetical protein